MTPARLIAAATGAAAVLVLAAGCVSPDNTTTPPEGSTPSATSAGSALPSTTSSAAAPTPKRTPSAVPSTTAEPTPSAPAADVTVAVVLKDGKVTPNGDNVRVKDGQNVQISLDSDVAESIHVHGYDKTVEVKAGKSDKVTFTADQKGVFEVETHETAKLVVKLIVS